jgi:hypothetical protein
VAEPKTVAATTPPPILNKLRRDSPRFGFSSDMLKSVTGYRVGQRAILK